MTAITDQFRDMFHILLMTAKDEGVAQPVLTLIKPKPGPHERHLSCSMQQLQSSLAEVNRILGDQPQLAHEWRKELLDCGRLIHSAIHQATSRMRTLGVVEHQGRAP